MNHPHSPACALCHRLFTPDNDELQPIPICGDCKFLLLDDHASPVQEDYRAMLPRLRGGGGTRRRSSESMEAYFSQVFNHARQSTSYEDYDSSVSLGVDAAMLVRRQSSGSRRWRRGLSDTESDGFDSFIGETGSNFSFGSSRFYHDSISVDDGEGRSDDDAFLENEDFSQPSGNETDNDIDPMHAGLHHWNSQDIEEDDVDEYVVWEETHGATFADAEQLAGEGYFRTSPRNYLQAREFDELLEHLAEANSSRRGAPPAAVSFVRALPRLVVTEDPQKPDELACAICKDPLHIGTVVNQLPCSHLYHPSCILPWLSSRNSCPLCRYELPTDDRDYEDRQQRNDSLRQQVGVNEEGSSSDEEGDISSEGDEELEGVDVNVGAERENRGRRGWMFLAAAAPVVGAILMLCFGSQAERRWRTNLSGAGRHQSRCLPPRDSGQNRGWGFLF